MKEKIFAALKLAYSSLGLGDEVLQAHAETLSGMGFVNDDNLQTVITTQKGFLETLQKVNDKRANDAAAKAAEKAKKEAEDAKAKAEAEALAKKEAEKKEAEKKAAEEAERLKLEALKKNNEIPEWFKKAQEERLAQAKAEHEAARKETEELKALIKGLTESTSKKDGEYQKQLDAYAQTAKERDETIKKLQETLVKQAEEAKAKEEAAAAEKAKADRQAKIVSKAKELGITKERIEEGFAIADSDTDEQITTYLTKVANNQKVSQLPFNRGFQLNQGEPTKEDVTKVAEGLVSNL